MYLYQLYSATGKISEYCQKLESICALSGEDIVKTINTKENKEILEYDAVKHIKFKDLDTALEYNKYCYFVTSLEDLFEEYDKDEIDLSYWDVHNVINMNSVFNGSGLKTINLTGWEVNNVEYASYMFGGCTELTNIIGFEKLNFKKLTEASHMFSNCENLKSIDLIALKDTKLETMDDMFEGCKNLEEIKNLDKLNTHNVKTTKDMFYVCKKLKDFSALKNMDLFNLENASGMFSESGIKSIKPFINWNVVNIEDMQEMFAYCKDLEDADELKNWPVHNMINLSGMFNGVYPTPYWYRDDNYWYEVEIARKEAEERQKK